LLASDQVFRNGSTPVDDRRNDLPNRLSISLAIRNRFPPQSCREVNGAVTTRRAYKRRYMT
jgi:hypothetical protein